MTDEAKKDLTAVLDRLAICQKGHRLGHISMFMTNDGYGCAYDDSQYFPDNYVEKQYGPAEKK